jgi:transcriptional regulator with XRE-family HTH domain
MEAGRWIRAVRRTGRLSQRELAERAGVPRSTVERIESGASSPRLETFAGLVAAAGLELVVCNADGRRVELDDSHDRLLDRGGRRFPAHLEYARTTGYFDFSGRTWWGWHNIAWPFTDEWVPEFTYWHRPKPPADS